MCGGFWAWVLWRLHINHSLLLLAMTTSSNNDHLQGAVLTQKQEWAAPKISLMTAEFTIGTQKNLFTVSETDPTVSGPS
jgi:hypothetical protein